MRLDQGSYSWGPWLCGPLKSPRCHSRGPTWHRQLCLHYFILPRGKWQAPFSGFAGLDGVEHPTQPYLSVVVQLVLEASLEILKKPSD